MVWEGARTILCEYFMEKKFGGKYDVAHLPSAMISTKLTDTPLCRRT